VDRQAFQTGAIDRRDQESLAIELETGLYFSTAIIPAATVTERHFRFTLEHQH
jgi:hypothetical protein